MIDFAIPPVKLLPHIATVIKGRIPILVDCSIQTGMDAFKALALGANAVGVGKTVMAGLAAKGADGVRFVLENMTKELQRTMSLTGTALVSDIDKSVLWE